MRTPNPNEYNGWKNYPTWAVNMWLSNDEALYNETRRVVSESCSNDDPGGNQYWASENLREWVSDDLGASFAADLLGYALDCVDWNEIASAWLSEVTA